MMARTPETGIVPAELRVLVLPAFSADRETAQRLSAAGIACTQCHSLDRVVAALQDGADCAVIAHAALQASDPAALLDWLDRQGAWSDLPIIILADRPGRADDADAALARLAAVGNLTMVEAQIAPTVLLAVVQNALRRRRRQYQARAEIAKAVARQAALQESEARFRTLADTIPVLAWIADADGYIVWYNARWYQYTGKTPEQLTGWGWQSVHDPALLPEVMAQWHLCLRQGVPLELVFPLRGADGLFRPFLTRIIPVHEHGRIVRWLGTNVDISAERASEERLRELNESLEQRVATRTRRLRRSEARLRAIFATSFLSQALLKRDGTVLDVNATLITAIGSPRADLVGTEFWLIPWFAATPGMPAAIEADVITASHGQPLRRELVLELIGGKRTFDFSLRPVRDEAGEVVALVAEAADISVTRNAEEALRQAQKMQAIGQLTGGIAHDFNNMLQGISSGIELMRRRILEGRPEQAERFVDAAHQSIDRAASLTHRLLAFSRRQSLAPQQVDLEQLVAGAAGLIRQTVGPAITVTTRLHDGCWPVTCDPNQLDNALLNLAINARDAMPATGGELIVQTAHVVLTADDTTGWEGAIPGDYVRVSVVDTGCGMPPDVLAHAFEPFFTTKPVGQGTGLGLSQVFGFISQSNGVIRIESKVGTGTSVHMFLPRHVGTLSDAVPSDRPSLHAGSAPNATVLLVDDEPDIRALAAEALRDTGFFVLEAKDGPEALAVLRDRIRSHGTGVDILVSDVGLPGGFNGRQLAEATRALSPGLPVLLITGFAGNALADGAQLQDRMELLCKPFPLNVLAARVGDMLRKDTAEMTDRRPLYPVLSSTTTGT